MLGERISGLKQGSKCIHFLVHGVVAMVLLVLGVLISLALRHAAFSPAPARSRDLPFGYIGRVIDLVV